jgi:hypothetical protein
MAILEKLSQLEVYPQIERVLDQNAADLYNRKITFKKIWTDDVLPLLPENHDITYSNFLYWAKKKLAHKRSLVSNRNLIDREMDKARQQIEIRQDATKLMHEFMQGLRDIADDPRVLAKNKINITDLYRIIRMEEDRQKSLQLKERAENRADASFAFMVSVAKANQLEEADIEFLEDSVKQELIALKKKNGLYELPNPAGQIFKSDITTEVTVVEPSQSYQTGA